MSDWNSNQYLKFEKQRTRASIDLAMHLNIENPQKILDIGCGPGNSTAVLARKYPNAYVLGVDNSENMVNAAKEKYSNIDFALCDVSSDLDKLKNDFDIVFSNACIQWVPNHKELLPNMMNKLKNGGVLAVQVPRNYDEPIHKIIGDVSSSEKWKNKFSSKRIFYTFTYNEYHDILSEISSDFDMWNTMYYHKMPSHQSIIDWYKSTGLRPYLNQLDDADKIEFEKDVYKEVEKAYPIQQNGEIIFSFPRLFFTAVK